MKTYYVVQEDEAGAILGGGWTKEAALADARGNAGGKTGYLVEVSESIGRLVDEEGDNEWLPDGKGGTINLRALVHQEGHQLGRDLIAL
jgi:hypothetical protein